MQYENIHDSNFITLSDLLEKISDESFQVTKEHNIKKVHDLLNKSTVFASKCADKQELNQLSRILLKILQKIIHEYFNILKAQTNNGQEEININISDELINMQELKIMGDLIIICNRLFEIFLGLIKFSEKLECALLIKGISNKKEKLFSLNIEFNIIKENALEIFNVCSDFFVSQRKFLVYNSFFQELLITLDKNIFQDSLLLSFFLVSSISSNKNHTYSMDIEYELIFFLINYIFNRNTEFNDYFIQEFSKKFDCMENIKSNKDKSNIKKVKFADSVQNNIPEKENNQMKYQIPILKDIFVKGLDILHMENFNFQSFFKDQFIRIAKNHLIKEIIIQKNTHFFISNIGQFLIFRIFHDPEISASFIETYSQKNNYVTEKIIIEMFQLDQNFGEKILKELIISKKVLEYKDMFFRKCNKLDSAYIECLLIFDDQIHQLSFEMFEKIMKSHFLKFMTRKKKIYKQILLKASEFLRSLIETDEKLDKNKFLMILFKKLLISKDKKGKNEIYTRKLTQKQSIESDINLESKLNLTNTDNYDILIEIIDKIILFVNTFPSFLENIISFTNQVLMELDKIKNMESNIQEDIFFIESTKSDSSTNEVLRCSRTINTEILSKILQLIRPYLNLNFKNLFNHIDPIYLMQNVIFKKKIILDSLFFNSINAIYILICEIKNDIWINESNDLVSNEDNNLEKERLKHVFLENMKDIWSSDDLFRSFIIFKKIDLSKLIEQPIFRKLILEDLPEKNEKNNFFDVMGKEKTSVSFSLDDRTVFQNKPLKLISLNDNSKANFSDNFSRTSLSLKTEVSSQVESQHLESPKNNKTNKMVICDVDDTFSNISLIPDEKNKKNYTYKHLQIDLMTERMKRIYLDENSENQSNEKMYDFCQKRLMLNYFFKSGLAFYTSKLEFEVKKGIFALFCDFHQYLTEGSQFLLKLFLKNKFFAIKIENNRLIMILSVNTEEKILFQEDITSNRFNIAINCNSKMFSCFVNDYKNIFNLGKILKIEIGDNFKGIIQKILFFENEKFDHKYRASYPPEEYFCKYLKNLQKRCSFYNNFGFFMSSENPYFLSSKMRDISIQNVFSIEQYDFLQSKK